MVTLGAILSNRYLLQDELGSGGMSTVYRAMDLRTGANVAVKIPHAFLLRDAQYIQRLTREAQIAATIQSARIATVTDVAEFEGTPYIVMEYVEGESLSQRLTRQGALPPIEALQCTLEVARAIDAAHARGVVHRDLKPQNICVTTHGDVKVLDFGIARMEGKPALTTASLFLGTPDYSAPERTEGRSDIRSDIYSLGVVLYELLAGKLPFDGGTPWTVMQMHTVEPPPPLPAGVPPAARAIVERCLEKNPERRYQTPRELVDALQAAIRTLDREETGDLRTVVMPATGAAAPAETIAHPPPAAGTGVVPPAPAPTSAPLPLAAAPPPTTPPVAPAQPARGGKKSPLVPILGGVAALLVIAVAAFFLLSRGGGDGGDDVVTDPASESPAPGGGQTGQSGQSGQSGQTGQTGQSSELTLTVAQPTAGERISGPVTIRLDATGINLKAPAEADPDGRHFHYFLDVDPATVLVPGAPIPTGQANIVHTANASHTFLDVPPGDHTIWAVLTGNDHVPLPRMQGKVSFTAIPDPLANARDGEKAPIVYQSFIDQKWRIVVKDGLSGQPRRLTTGDANDYNPAFSPDGSRIAFNSDRDGGQDIYTMNLDGSDLKRITEGNSTNRNPAYAPDGSSIVFVSNRDGRDHLWIVPVNGGQPQQLTRGNQNDGAPSWALDGQRIAYHADVGGVTQIFVIPRGGGMPRQITEGVGGSIRPVWSPDGKKIAFARFADNQWNIYTMNADGSGIQRLTDTSYNVNPAWSPDAKQILFQSDREGGNQQIFVMAAEGGAARRVTQLTAINAVPWWPLR